MNGTPFVVADVVTSFSSLTPRVAMSMDFTASLPRTVPGVEQQSRPSPQTWKFRGAIARFIIDAHVGDELGELSVQLIDDGAAAGDAQAVVELFAV